MGLCLNACNEASICRRQPEFEVAINVVDRQASYDGLRRDHVYSVRGAIRCARRVHAIFFVRGIGNELPADAVNVVPTKTAESTLAD